MRWPLVLIACGTLTLLSPPAWAEESAQVVTGTVSELDAERLKLTIRTDLDKNVYVEVAQPDLLREVHAGDRVTLRLNNDGKAEKITRLTVPELPAPLDSAPPQAGP